MDELRKLIEALYGVRTDDLSEEQLRRSLGGTEVMQRNEASLLPDTVNQKDRSVEVVITTEDPARVIDWERWEVVDEILLMDGLRMDQIRKGKLPLLDGHRRSQASDVLGSTVDLRTEDGKFLGREVWSSQAEAEFIKTTEGHLDQRSVGYRRFAVTYIEPGESGTVNGRTFTAPSNRGLEVVTDWIAVEQSVTPIGADPNAGTRAAREGIALGDQSSQASNTNDRESQTMDPKVRAQLIAWGMKADATEAEAWSFMMARVAAGNAGTPPAVPETPPPASGTDGPSGRSGADDNEQENLAQRNAAVLDVFAPFAARTGVAELQGTCLREAVTVDQARARLVEHLAAETTQAGRSAVTVLQSGDDSFRENVSAGLALRSEQNAAGSMRMSPEARAAAMERGGDFANRNLLRMAEDCLEFRGVNTKRMGKMDLVARAFTHSSGDFPYALENTARKSLLGAYQSAPQTWDAWCQRGSLSDFKTASIVKVGEFSILSEVPEGAEYPFTTMDEEKETIYLLTYGDIFPLTRQAIINDDLSVFSDIPTKFGRAWGRTVNRLPVVALLANGNMNDGNALFSLTHANLLEGTAYDPTSVAKAQAAVKGMTSLLRAQTDVNSEVTLGLSPKIVLTGATNEYFWSQAIFEAGRADENTNVFLRRLGLSLVIEPELENTGITGYSTTATHLLADPADAPVMRVAFLDGNDAPRLESQMGFHVDGTEFKISGDVGVGKVDWRGGVKATGIAAA